ncbi:MAG TPA: 4-hydroxy-tetrahydrodipicolinate synthase [Candidatus Saccharimonadia bacterium]|nr:4-hydroxy-tetrahydrodipicolinate synthase [Candidatus Saccharimonadia bacterium]
MRFTGSICAIVTPFTPDGELDLAAFERLLDWHRDAGTEAIVVAGSTGESAALEEAEFEALVATAASRLDGSLPVIAGCGAAATHKAARLVARARLSGADAALVVTPYYVRPTQEGLYRHYSARADGGELPVVLYNVPGRTGCDLLPETVARLAPHPMIVGVKEARPDEERMQALLALRDDGFAVLSGDDPTAARAMLAGADGVISVAANACPAAFRKLCGLVRERRGDAARALDAELAPLYGFLGVEPNPIPVKWLLARQGRIASALRLPLTELTAAHHAAANESLALLDRVERGSGASRAA